MRLKEIELKGFKSFSNKTKIEFKNGITAVVGPNGSGKSNISDAVRWVLGEQSIKTLRGNKMEDVIFAGTDNKKPLGFAEVTITFDNKSGLIPIEYEEVAITRRVFRSGESEYFLNKNSCRLKDIRELLMDTGIGKEGYSIIGQGRIGEILSNNPADRRGIFEEAAGIIKYKSKKDESVKKLIKTDENLVRINDLLSELEQQEGSLKRQADKAVKYRENYDVLKKLEINLLVKNIADLKKSYEVIKSKELETHKELESINGKYQELEEELVSFKENLKLKESSFEERHNINIEKSKDIDKLKNDIKILQEQIKYIEIDLKRIEDEEEILKNTIKDISSKILINNDEIEKKERYLEEIRQKFADENKSASELFREISELEEYIETSKDSTITMYNNISDKKSEFNSIKSLSENMNQRLDQLSKYILDEEEKLKLELNNQTRLNTELEDSDKSINSQNESIKNLEIEKNRINSELLGLDNNLNKLSLSIERNISSYNVYKKMEESYEGYYKGVKNILNIAKRDELINTSILGVVAELIKVKDDYELAITTALGSSAQFIVTPDQRAAKTVINKLYETKGGRVTCLPLDTIKGKNISINENDKAEFNVVGIASELVDFDKSYKNIIDNLLGKTVIVKDMDSGISLSNKYKNSMRIVTLKGNVINPGGSMTGGSQNQSGSSLLSRKNQIENIVEEIKNEKSSREVLLKDRQEKVDKLEKLARDFNIITTELKELELSKVSLNSKSNVLSEEIVRIKNTIDKYKLEISELELGNSEFVSKSLGLENSIKELELKLEEVKTNVKNKNLELMDLNSRKEEESKKLTDNKISINKVDNELSNLKNLNKDLSDRILELENKFAENSDTKANKTNELSRANENILELNKEVKAKEIEFIKLKDLEVELKQNIEIEEQHIDNKDKILKETSIKKEELSSKANEINLKKVKEEMGLEAKNEELLDKYELSFDEAETYIDKDIDIEESKPEIKRLRDIISKLGTVNLSSIEEYELLAERLTFIKEQKEDLLTAKLDLEKVILKIDKTMKEKFKEEFYKINKNFEEIFKILFNGGQASLVIEDEDDILNSGIEIKAMPPGKKLQNLSSLSGGERSLIAVSLLFAILKIKPSPFCILDEIDAALDEANIGRYTSYLKDISDKTQFIIITHRKRTMEIANVLYGVTMEEEGISKLISVELKDFEEEAS